jgi:hypothetical protein
LLSYLLTMIFTKFRSFLTKKVAYSLYHNGASKPK